MNAECIAGGKVLPLVATVQEECCGMLLQAEVGTPTEEAPGCGGLQLAVDVSPCAGLRLQVVARSPSQLPAHTAVVTPCSCDWCPMVADSLGMELPRLARWQPGTSTASSCEPAAFARNNTAVIAGTQ